MRVSHLEHLREAGDLSREALDAIGELEHFAQGRELLVVEARGHHRLSARQRRYLRLVRVPGVKKEPPHGFGGAARVARVAPEERCCCRHRARVPIAVVVPMSRRQASPTLAPAASL
jgi:hypothetical protein